MGTPRGTHRRRIREAVNDSRFFRVCDNELIRPVPINALIVQVGPGTLTIMWNTQGFVMAFGESPLRGSWQSNRREVNH